MRKPTKADYTNPVTGFDAVMYIAALNLWEGLRAEELFSSMVSLQVPQKEYFCKLKAYPPIYLN